MTEMGPRIDVQEAHYLEHATRLTKLEQEQSALLFHQGFLASKQNSLQIVQQELRSTLSEIEKINAANAVCTDRGPRPGGEFVNDISAQDEPQSENYLAQYQLVDQIDVKYLQDMTDDDEDGLAGW